MIKDQMDKIYRDTPLDQIPWNVRMPPAVLQAAMKANVTRERKAVELGCGAGNYVIHFSKMVYDVTGVDISENAIRIARNSALAAGVNCKFFVGDVLGDLPGIINTTFDFVYDWELLHHIFPEDREHYCHNVNRLLNPEGHYLSVCFSEESPQFGGVGKYRNTPLDTILYFSSEKELETLFTRYFVVEDLKTIDVKSKYAVHRAIYAFMKKKSS